MSFWIRLIMAVNAAVGAGAILVDASHPGRAFFDGLGFLATFLMCAAVQLVGAFLMLASKERKQLWRFAVVFLGALVLAGLVSRTLWPLRARVLLSEAWLRPYAAELLKDGSGDPRSVGLFRVRAGAVRNGVLYLSTGVYGLYGDAGVAFVPGNDAANPERRGSYFEHLYGPWWRYTAVDG